ncbi:MAG: hypothetical protein H6711_21145 [Myxococcales bacterium]|nr:hypothetical protein [Myxococcales bacterium]
MIDELAAEIDESLRRAEGAGYSERLDGLGAAGWAAQRLARRLDRASARERRGLLARVLEMPIVGGCTPACCNASWVRMSTIDGKASLLRAWSQHDPEVAETLPPELVAPLLIPDSRRIAMAAAELLSRSPGGAARHVGLICDALGHPRWQVVEALVRALGRLPRPPPRAALDGLQRAARHPRAEVQRAAARALERLGVTPTRGGEK